MRGLPLVGLAALVLAGCSAPAPTPAPVKLDDLDLTPYMGKPCSLFDADQLSDLGLTRPVERPEQPNLSVCVLSAKDPGAFGAIVHLETRATAPKTDDHTKVAGYPALERPGPKDCTVWVVVADHQRLMAETRGDNACHSAENVATSAIATIKRQNP
ncbi:DUF3558 family protein [Kutzneria kofuensis]|uniref:DUF3558 domain-containing protein n=1 Tax=Kutzneria kofuensis TaxID=103725 RepID=A0A7W9NJR9_9PSEU|nr:DUF3558 family protein [Kutzneria kofuensis]MBB5894443.1 hypothetical protein [Kutzneria kofuensis]